MKHLLLLTLVVFAIAVTLVGCSDGGDSVAGPLSVDPVVPDPDDPTIPPIPSPNSAQVIAKSESEPGEYVARVLYDKMKNPLSATVVGSYHIETVCDPNDPGSCSDYDDKVAAFSAWLEDTGAGYFCETEQDGERVLGPIGSSNVPAGANTGSDIITECITFQVVTPQQDVYLQHDRLWKNLTSRLLGPGTAYEITYTWLEGVETSNGFEWGQTSGATTVTESTWNNCVEGSVKASAKAGFDIGFASAEVSVETSLRDEYCFGGKNSQEVSQTLSQSLSQTNTITSQRGGSETTSVSGADGVDRIYTVWQLMDQYSYVKVDGTHISTADLTRDSAFTGLTSSAPDEWRAAGIIWPNGGSVRQGTNFFAQMTRDFLVPGSSARVDPQPVLQFFEAPSNR
jgi:hypothetical protein